MTKSKFETEVIDGVAYFVEHSVMFISPGTLVSETTTEPIPSWDVGKAIKMMKKVRERHGAVPYCFCFFTDGRTAEEFKPKRLKQSTYYFRPGKLMTLDDIPDTEENRILRSNMVGNKYETVYETTSGWRTTVPFKEGYIMLTEEEYEKEIYPCAGGSVVSSSIDLDGALV